MDLEKYLISKFVALIKSGFHDTNENGDILVTSDMYRKNYLCKQLCRRYNLTVKNQASTYLMLVHSELRRRL